LFLNEGIGEPSDKRGVFAPLINDVKNPAS